MNSETVGAPSAATLPTALSLDPVVLALRLTLLELLLRPVGDWHLRALILSLAAAGLLFPSQLLKPRLWFALAFLAGLRVLLDWPLPDNHAYLLCYWCLAIAIALASRDPRVCLALNGRVLIGLVFAFATLWKLVLSPDYVDGRFFRVTLLVDERFTGFTQIVGGLDPDQYARLRDFVDRHPESPYLDGEPMPEEPQRFRYVAQVCAWWNILIDGAIALAFLWPPSRGSPLIRDGLLLVFCVTTYAIATVEGFGWLLIAMGVAQSGPQARRTRLLYLLTFALILFYREVPWAEEIVMPLLRGFASAG